MHVSLSPCPPWFPPWPLSFPPTSPHAFRACLPQADSGAQVLQVFDSWAATLGPKDYDSFALPYQQRVIKAIKARHPEVPVILYVKQSG